jgi:heme exporter protein D
MNLGPHASFIVAAYAIVVIVVALLIGWVIADHRRQRAILRDLEASGVQRRSARQASASS